MKKQLMHNKRKFFLISGIFTFLVIATIFVSCKENSGRVSNEISPLNDSYLKFEGEYLDHLNAVKVKQTKDLNKPITYLSSELSIKDFKRILSMIPTNFSNEKIEKIIFYSNDDDLFDIKTNNIKAFSVFLSENNKYHIHHLFKKKGNTFTEDENYTVRANHSLEYGDINQLAFSLMEDENSINWVLFKPKGANFKTVLSQVTSDFKRNVINNSKTLLVGEALSPCRSATESCPNMDYGATCREDGCYSGGGEEEDGPGDDGEDCPRNEADATARKVRISTKGLDSDFAYNFRDNFLKKTEKEKKYVTYYYKISRISSVYDGINVQNIADRVAFVKAMYKVAHTLVEGADDDIVFDEGTTAISLKTLNEYSKLSNNKEYKEILKDIEKDVKQFSKKTKKEIKSQI